MAFEYDAAKGASNRRKHGIDFEEAQTLWDEPRDNGNSGGYGRRAKMGANWKDRRTALVGGNHTARRKHPDHFSAAIARGRGGDL